MALLAKQLLLDGVDNIIVNGANVLVKFMNYTFASGDYDDALGSVVVIGSQYSSGLMFPIKGLKGSQEAMLLEEGKLRSNDKAVYFSHDLVLGGSSYLLYLGNDVYSIIPDGVYKYEMNGSTIYQKVFMRRSPTGSLF